MARDRSILAVSRPGLRRPVVAALVLQQVLLGAGVSLPVPAAAANPHERFPCEHCGCGCRTAEQCWRHCCCMTDREKIAWARRNHVVVPDYVLAAAARDTAAGRRKCPHCSGEKTKGERAAGTVSGERPRSKNQGGGRAGFRYLTALACQGSAAFWLAAGASWPGDEPMVVRVALPPLGRAIPEPLPQNPFLPPAPPTPPPRAI